MRNIRITIPAQELKEMVHTTDSNTYILTALKNMGHNNVEVTGYGATYIDNQLYLPKQRFNHNQIYTALENNKPLTIELVPIIARERTIIPDYEELYNDMIDIDLNEPFILEDILPPL